MATHVDLAVLASIGDAVSLETQPSQVTLEVKDQGILMAGGQAARIQGGAAIALPPKMEDNPKRSWPVDLEFLKLEI